MYELLPRNLFRANTASAPLPRPMRRSTDAACSKPATTAAPAESTPLIVRAVSGGTDGAAGIMIIGSAEALQQLGRQLLSAAPDGAAPAATSVAQFALPEPVGKQADGRPAGSKAEADAVSPAATSPTRIGNEPPFRLSFHVARTSATGAIPARELALLERFEVPGVLRAIVWLLAFLGAVSLVTTLQ